MTRIEESPDEAEGLDDLLQGVRALDARLDEVARARIAAGLGRHLAARDVERASGDAGDRRRTRAALRWLLPLASAGLAAGLVLAMDARRGGERPAQRIASNDLDRLEVPAGARARARLGRADVTVLGPAQLEVTRNTTVDMTLRLSSGTLVGDYDGHAGGRLRIETPRLVAQIVGTRFAIEATTGHARVSVAHGRVAVREAAAPEGAPEIFVEAGQSWEAGRARPIPAPAAVAHLLAEPAGDDAALPEAPPPAPPAVPAPVTGAAHEHPAAATPPPRSSAPPPEPAVTHDGPPIARPVQVASRLEPPPLAPAPTPPPAAAPAPADLYRRAEVAMLQRDGAGARRWLEELVARYPHDPASDSARFELARDAMAARAPARASRWLDELIAAGRDRSLIESALFLKCRLAREGGETAEARSCLTQLRAQHPGSARDEEALAALALLAQQEGACDQARALRAEHRRLYPAVSLPEGDRARCPR